MGFFDRLFGRGENMPPTELGAVRLAAGRGYTFNIVGESQFQPALSKLCGGKINGGHKRESIAHLMPEPNPHDPNAIAVEIEGRRVGWVPATLAADLRREIAALNADRTLSCKAKIVGGWLGKDGEGHFGVKLSLSRPLKRSTQP